MSATGDVTITLTDAQVAQVLDEASGRASVASVLPELSALDTMRSVLLSIEGDARCSRSALRALLVLAAFPGDGGERELTDVARELGFSPSTAHRYIGTWLAIGLLEQEPRSRRYRRTLAARAAGERLTPAGGGTHAG